MSSKKKLFKSNELRKMVQIATVIPVGFGGVQLQSLLKVNPIMETTTHSDRLRDFLSLVGIKEFKLDKQVKEVETGRETVLASSLVPRPMSFDKEGELDRTRLIVISSTITSCGEHYINLTLPINFLLQKAPDYIKGIDLEELNKRDKGDSQEYLEVKESEFLCTPILSAKDHGCHRIEIANSNEWLEWFMFRLSWRLGSNMEEFNMAKKYIYEILQMHKPNQMIKVYDNNGHGILYEVVDKAIATITNSVDRKVTIATIKINTSYSKEEQATLVNIDSMKRLLNEHNKANIEHIKLG